jgi:hypothetical protein
VLLAAIAASGAVALVGDLERVEGRPRRKPGAHYGRAWFAPGEIFPEISRP